MAVNAPIALFVYNRPDHTQRTVGALRNNSLAAASDLIVFCDGAKNVAAAAAVQEVRWIIRAITGFKSVRIVEHNENRGLAESIIGGVTAVCEEFGRAIVMEDDLVTAPSFLSYMNQALSVYENDARVGSIHGYWYPISSKLPETFFLRGASCWGWATWSRAWRLFEPDGSKLLAQLQERGLTRRFDLDGAMAYTQMLKDQIAGKNNSWGVRWHAAMFLAERLQLSPSTSLVRNIGFDGTGVHSWETNVFEVELAVLPVQVGGISVAESAAARAALIDYYRGTRRTLLMRIMGRLRRMMRL